MKQGSTDDPFAEEPRDGDETAPDVDENSRDDAAERGDDVEDDQSAANDESDTAAPEDTGPDGDDSAPATGSIDPASSSAGDGSAPAEREPADADTAARTDPDTDSSSSGDATAERQTLPYIHARDGVKDGRTQRPVFLRDHVEAGIDDLVAEMEAELGEDVYKTDVTEAAMAVAQENPDLVLAKLEEWGYGWT